MSTTIRLFTCSNVSRVLSLNTNYTFCRQAQIRTVWSWSVPCTKCFKTYYKDVNGNVSKTANLSFYRHLSESKKQDATVRQMHSNAVSQNIKPNVQDLHDLFPLRFTYIRTNVTFWEEFPEGLQFDVGYVDTKLQKDAFISDRKPVILGLPSSVGDHAELTSVLMTFAKLGYRVVIPNLPGSSFCRGKRKEDEAVFQFTIQEKADFVKDFLKELGITKVDMLVTNSCSVYTGVHLCVFQTSLFRSLVMINPTGLQPTKSMLPLWIHRQFTATFDNRYILQGLFKGFVAGVKIFTKKRHWETINVVSYSRNVAALSFSDGKIVGEYLKSRNIPRYAIFGEDSETLDVPSTIEYLSLLDIPQSAITELNETNNIVKQGTPFNENYGLHIKGNRSEDMIETRAVVLRRELLKILKSICSDL